MSVFELMHTSKGLAGFYLPSVIGKKFVSLREIVRLEGRRNYTLFILKCGKEVMVSRTIGLFEMSLPSSFVRVTRGCIINLDYLATAETGVYQLKDGFKVVAARRRIKQLDAISVAA